MAVLAVDAGAAQLDVIEFFLGEIRVGKRSHATLAEGDGLRDAINLQGHIFVWGGVGQAAVLRLGEVVVNLYVEPARSVGQDRNTTVPPEIRGDGGRDDEGEKKKEQDGDFSLRHVGMRKKKTPLAPEADLPPTD